ncbi:N-acetyltransferase [Sinorhizobium meliloti]|uniref:GNAT family N-acetyltransferase n=1 Tax=Sinorhizobium TaxID=28105 RepID=UPI0004A46A61|nr:N-acetyltransferase [Sinorhizobium meliloti RU11/001]RVG61670.1 N-acetyltransferase [Sinorhizobium meliloti]RVG89156.1 N-acetyltransferase [Sinorhizobium meliloti]RVH54820.1 N-acetyltransferase [Sinorhizobium meliloti]RVH60816.1 N-acetyltransferase [Sinorhizobium meliloti]
MDWFKDFAGVELENEYAHLRSISFTDRPALAEIAFDADIWRYFVQRIDTDVDLDRFIEQAVEDTAANRRVVFAVLDKATGALAGSMAYGNLAEADRRLEIGWSWLGRAYRGKGLNRWAKFLLLQHAFEKLDCERVEFKTDVLNLQARKGLQNIGATEEGVLRSFNYMPDGRRRDAIYYSILRLEWPIVRSGLLKEVKLTRAASEMVGAGQ